MTNRFFASTLYMLFLLIFAYSSFCATAYARGNSPKEVDIHEAAKLVKEKPENLIILDVRTPAEYKEGHLANARNVDFFGGKFDTEILALPKDDTILVYCRSGKRSAGAAQELERAGYNKVLHMHDGLDAWQRAGLPVEK